jgi:hypothetical protein
MGKNESAKTVIAPKIFFGFRNGMDVYGAGKMRYFSLE